MRKAKPVVQFRLRITKAEEIAIGPGKVELLEAVVETGSITSAAKQLGMSYRRAWLLIDTMNRSFKTPVVEALAGGPKGGGTRVTATGREVIRLYRAIERKAARTAAADLSALIKRLG
jgi:molybdate transport system regulatory protein